MKTFFILVVIGIIALGGAIAAGIVPMEKYVNKYQEQKRIVPGVGLPEENTDYSDLIKISSPKPLAKITSPLIVRGEARGTWFFEGDFPIVLADAEGNEIAVGHATAQGEWMTEDFVPFEGKLTFTKPHASTGKLIFEKANPSGLSENTDEFTVLIRF